MSFRSTALGATVAILLAGGAIAAPVTPTFGTFGEIADAGVTTEFGGDGISGANTAYDTFSDESGNQLTLGLTITPRFGAAPTPANDGAGTFTVQPGLATPPGSSFEGTLWNFSFFGGLTPADGQDIDIADIGLELLYDLDSAAGTDTDDLGSINLSYFALPDQDVSEGSQNLNFSFLSNGTPGVTPGLNTFDPNAGEYSFLLRATNFADGSGVVAVQTNVAPVPLPAGLPLLLAGLGGLAFLRQRKAA